MRLIDADKYIEEESEGAFLGDISIEKFNEITPTVGAYTKDQVAAMITELQLDISELKSYESADGQDLVMLADIGTLFQQKINNLKVD